MNSTVPNSVDEDLVDGADEFLRIKENVSYIEKKEMFTLRHDSKGKLVNRSLLGSADYFVEKFKQKNIKESLASPSIN